MDEGPPLSNGIVSELLWRAGTEETGHRRRALHRAAGAARFWDREAADVVAAGGSLTELHSVGPWVAEKIHGYLDAPPVVPEADEDRRDYLTMAEVRRILDANPEWEATPHGDLQVHSTDSDGSLPLQDMALAARASGARSSRARTIRRA